MSENRRCIRCGKQLSTAVQYFPTTEGGYICSNCVPVLPPEPVRDHTPALARFLNDYHLAHNRGAGGMAARLTDVHRAVQRTIFPYSTRTDVVEGVFELLADVVDAANSPLECESIIRLVLSRQKVRYSLYPRHHSEDEYAAACRSLLDCCLSAYKRRHSLWQRFLERLDPGLRDRRRQRMTEIFDLTQRVLSRW
jgi:hypothetical protein